MTDMEHIDERALDRYLLNRSGMPPEEQGRVGRHLEVCSRCRSLMEYLEAFHKDLDRTEPTSTEELDRFVRNLAPIPSTILLKPFRYMPGPDETPKQYSSLMAAMTVSQPQSRYETVCTLASEEQQAIARIVRDRQEDRYQLYLIADDPRKHRYALISIPGLRTELVADERGRVEFQGDYQTTDWQNITAVLQTMGPEYFLSKQHIERMKSGNTIALESLKVSLGETRLSIVAEESSAPTRVLIAMPAAPPVVARFEKNKATVNLSPIPETITLRLYM